MRRFDPEHMERLLGPERGRWQDPEAVLDALGLSEGMVAADIGCGPGFFTLPMARRVGPKGRVIAVDAEPRMLERLRERAADEGAGNIEYLLSEGGSLLADNSLDAALMVNVLHESEEPEALLGEVLRALRPGGAFAVVEWKREYSGSGPPAEIRIAPDRLTSLMQGAGFVLITAFKVGEHHYGMRGLKAS